MRHPRKRNTFLMRWSAQMVFYIGIVALFLLIWMRQSVCHTSDTRPSFFTLDKLQALKYSIDEALGGAIKQRRNNKIRHVMVLMGTRPEAIKLAPVILEMKSRPEEFLCTVVSTGQQQSMLLQALDAFGLGNGLIDLSLDLMTTNQTLATLTSRVMMGMDTIFSLIRPNILIVQGDTTTAYVGALAAFYHKIPIGHVEAGLRTDNRYSPFPEEVNRQGIGMLASLNFAATTLAAKNLAREGKDMASIFVTGNPVVDALRQYGSGLTQKAVASSMTKVVESAVATNCGSVPCRLLLLTAHRRENHGQPLQDILAAVTDILKAHSDVLIAFPVHLNPNVRQAIAAAVPTSVYQSLHPGGKPATTHDQKDTHLHEESLSRLLLLPPLEYPDLVHVMNISRIILTDSGGIQEEGVVLGKPVVVLRDTTERPEGVRAGAARLVGTNPAKVVATVNQLLENDDVNGNMNDRNIYGDGQAAERIVDLVQWYLDPSGGACHESAPSSPVCLPPPMPSYAANDDVFDLVIVLTVWKRDTLSSYLGMLAKQTLLRRPGLRTAVLVFQNGNHLDVTRIVDDWQAHARDRWHGHAVTIVHIKSPVATGYYGRFLAPFVAQVRSDGYFVIFDDDLLFGSRFLENMVRVVDSGALAVRVGRFIGKTTTQDGKTSYMESFGITPDGWQRGAQVTYAEDVIYDFGGQAWAGKFDWLRVLWSHPPPVWITSEDFWISAVLQTELGIATKRPRCPPEDVEECACSMDTANDHKPVEVGAHTGGEFDVRSQAITDIARAYGYQPLENAFREKESAAYTLHAAGRGPFYVESSPWIKQCLHFV